MTYTVTEAENGLEIKEFLRRRQGFSGTLIKELKRLETGILLNGVRVTVRAVLKSGDVLTLDCDTEQNGSAAVLPAKQDGIRLLYEDEALLVFSKPTGMPTHPSRGHLYDTLANGAAYIFSGRGTPFVFRSITRLDSDVSGLVLCAATKLAAARLSGAIARGEIKKTYIAVTDGVLGQPGQTGSVSGYVRRRPDSIITREFSDVPDGAFARTDWRVLAANGTNSLVAASPVTGRTHQIRVSLAYAGAPVSGDGFYGLPETDAPRCMLHCRSLELAHPLTGERLTLSCPLYEDMRCYIAERFEINSDEY